MEVLEDIQVTKIVDPKLLGVHQGKNVSLYIGKFGDYLKHDGWNYSIPDWAKKENLKEMFNLYHAIQIIDRKNKKKVDNEEVKAGNIMNTFQNYKNAF